LNGGEAMARLVEYEDGVIIEIAETDPAPADPDNRLGRDERLGRISIEQLAKRFEDELSGIKKVEKALAAQMKSIEPAEVKISFSIKIAGSLGAVIAQASTEGQFGVEMTWRH